MSRRIWTQPRARNRRQAGDWRTRASLLLWLVPIECSVGWFEVHQVGTYSILRVDLWFINLHVRLHFDETVGIADCLNIAQRPLCRWKVGIHDCELSLIALTYSETQASFKLGSVAAALPRTPGFNARQPLVIFMHGFIDDHTLFAFPLVNEAFQSIGKESLNIIFYIVHPPDPVHILAWHVFMSITRKTRIRS